MCLALTQACIKENFDIPSAEIAEGEELTINMSVSVPGMEVATRALGEYNYADGAHPTLWVVVFDQQGYLVEYAKATEQEYNGGADNETKFSVKLHQTPEPCIIHYLLNYADELTLDPGHESGVIGGLTVGPDEDVYWQRRVLPGGINADADYVAANFTRIPLVRNFAKITVSVAESVSNFSLTGYYVLNVPKTGTVAPYTNGAFVNYQPTLAADQTLYDALTASGYVGNEPDGLEFDRTAAPEASDFSTAAAYVYENTAKDDNLVTTILIKGRFGNDTADTYYKADLVTSDLVTGLSENAHILRNFHYNLNITSVAASGKTDIAGAISAAANNNLSGAVEIKDLTNITNGTAGLYVSFTDTTLVSSAPIVLKYKFLTDVSNKSSFANDRVVISAPSGKVVSSWSKGGLISTPTTSSWYGYQELIINPQALPAYTVDQTIVLYDQTTKLRREVVLRLRPKLDLVVDCAPLVVDATAGESMTLNLMFDANLNKALFPLDFTIESQTNATSSSLKQYISPAKSEVISVKTGTSIVPGFGSAKSYQYVKTLSYDDYTKLSKNEAGQVVFPIAFVTNTAASASTVYVRNQYFNDANDFFLNEAASLIDGGFYGAGNEVRLVFTATAAGDYTVTSDDMALTKAMETTVNLAAGAVHEMSLYTSDWSDPVAVAITGPSSYSESFEGVTRNKLAMKATSIKVGDVEYTGYATYGVYTSEASAKAMTGSIGTAVSADLKTASGSLLVRDGLAEGTTLWFAYEDSESIYVASATAGALHNGAELNFVGTYKPLDMQVEFGTGADRYGEGQAFTLTFTTNRTGKYVVTSLNFNGITANEEFEATAGVPVTVNCAHSSWSTQASIAVKFSGDEAGGTNPETFTGPVRNKLVLGKMTAQSNAPSDNKDIQIRNVSNNTSYATVKWSELKAGGVEVTIPELADMNSEAIVLRYKRDNNNSYRKTSVLTATQAMGGTTLNFN